MPHGDFSWYQLCTTDVEPAGAFYRRLLDWQGRDAGMPGMTYILLSKDGVDVGGMMALPEDVLKAAIGPYWMGYVEVEDVDATAARVSASGGVIHSPPADIPDVGRFAVIGDPQGAVLSLIHWNEGNAPPPAPANRMGAVGWHELAASDWPAVFPFYAELFGWTKGEPIDMGGMGTYQLFEHGGRAIGGMFNKPPEMPAPGWLYYAQVPDIAAAVATIAAEGGQVLHGPMEVPGGAWIAQGRDPQGAYFAVVAPPAGEMT